VLIIVPASVIETGGKFTTGDNDTAGECEYLCKCSKKFEMTLMLFSGAWGKMIHENSLKQKIS
jgi:hypothetical protein